MSHTYGSNYLHIVFATKDRSCCITDVLRPRLWKYMSGIACTNNFKVVEVGGTDDHIHLLISLPPTMTISKSVQLLKGGSSKWVHDTFPKSADFGWQEGFGYFSVSFSNIPASDQVYPNASRASPPSQLRRRMEEITREARDCGIPVVPQSGTWFVTSHLPSDESLGYSRARRLAPAIPVRATLSSRKRLQEAHDAFVSLRVSFFSSSLQSSVPSVVNGFAFPVVNAVR